MTENQKPLQTKPHRTFRGAQLLTGEIKPEFDFEQDFDLECTFYTSLWLNIIGSLEKIDPEIEEININEVNEYPKNNSSLSFFYCDISKAIIDLAGHGRIDLANYLLVKLKAQIKDIKESITAMVAFKGTGDLRIDSLERKWKNVDHIGYWLQLQLSSRVELKEAGIYFNEFGHLEKKDSEQLLKNMIAADQPAGGKLKWLGTPAQLAFIINLLNEKGYLTGLTQSGEKNAEMLLEIFSFSDHSPSKESLGKCFQKLKNDELPINAIDASKFQRIPKRNELKK